MSNLEALASQLLLPALFLFALVWSVVGAAIGAGLIVSRGTMLGFFSRVNAWIPMRSRLKWAEAPHDIGPALLAYRAWLAAFFIGGGLFTLGVTLWQFDLERLVVRPQFVAGWLLESLKWLLVAGSLAAIAVGVLLAAFPAVLARLEAQADRWVSTRQAGRALGEGGDRMHLALDRCVAAYPRAAGWILIALSLACIASVGTVLVS